MAGKYSFSTKVIGLSETTFLRWVKLSILC
jgi:hypothetical protein